MDENRFRQCWNANSNSECTHKAKEGWWTDDWIDSIGDDKSHFLATNQCDLGHRAARGSRSWLVSWWNSADVPSVCGSQLSDRSSMRIFSCWYGCWTTRRGPTVVATIHTRPKQTSCSSDKKYAFEREINLDAGGGGGGVRVGGVRKTTVCSFQRKMSGATE